MTRGPLQSRQGTVDREMILLDEMSDDRVAVADMLAVVDDIGQLAARGGFRVENMLMPGSQVAQLQKAKTFSP